MRTISKTGKDIIRLIVKQPEGKLDVLGASLTGRIFGLDKIGVFIRKEQGSSLLFPVNPACAENVRRSKRELVSLLSLLTYLEDEGLIFVIDGNMSDTFFFCDADDPVVGNDGSTQYYNYEKGRIEIENGLYKAKDKFGTTLMSGTDSSPVLSSCMNHFLTGEIYATESLRELVANDFKSQDELQYEKELKYTRRGLYISLVALGISMFSNIISIPLSNKFGTSTINSNQFMAIDTTLVKINKGIDTIKSQCSFLLHKSAVKIDSMKSGKNKP